MSRCIITGCRLVLTGEHKSLWGDLFELDSNIYVFSGVRDVDLVAAWDYVYPDSDKDERQLLVEDKANYFEKRGIVTVDAGDCYFNEAAKRYLGDV